jgi:predicted ATPase
MATKNENKRAVGSAAMLFHAERERSMATERSASGVSLDRVYTHAGWIRTDENSTVIVMRANKVLS